MGEASELEAEEPGGLDETEEFQAGKIYCANCVHCKMVPAKIGKDPVYVLRIRCVAGKWKKRLGEEKLYKYCTIMRRYLDTCDAYEEMGDTREFIRDLRKDVPRKDEVYTFQGGTGRAHIKPDPEQRSVQNASE